MCVLSVLQQLTLCVCFVFRSSLHYVCSLCFAAAFSGSDHLPSCALSPRVHIPMALPSLPPPPPFQPLYLCSPSFFLFSPLSPFLSPNPLPNICGLQGLLWQFFISCFWSHYSPPKVLEMIRVMSGSLFFLFSIFFRLVFPSSPHTVCPLSLLL